MKEDSVSVSVPAELSEDSYKEAAAAAKYKEKLRSLVFVKQMRTRGRDSQHRG